MMSVESQIKRLKKEYVTAKECLARTDLTPDGRKYWSDALKNIPMMLSDLGVKAGRIGDTDNIQCACGEVVKEKDVGSHANNCPEMWERLAGN